MVRKHFANYNFIADPITGYTFRWGNTIEENPNIAPWPELADISISNYCTNNCEYCYRGSNSNGKFISINEYNFILNQLTHDKYGSVFQIALGGGEPLLHPHFVEMLEITRENFRIIPNYTTNGNHFNEEILEATKKYCGAIAVSYDSYRTNLNTEMLIKIGKLLKEYGINANIHYVLSIKTIKDAINILKGQYDKAFQFFNAIIFLTYKPYGRANINDSLKVDENINNFLKQIDYGESKLKIGFDACFVPFLLQKTRVDPDFIDSCECAFFSVYIDENLNVMPCSFCNDKKYTFNLREYDFSTIWKKHFGSYREKVRASCRLECNNKDNCRGNCIFYDSLFLCKDLINKNSS